MQHEMKPTFDNKTHPLNFLPKDTYDPLRHATTDLFWYHVEPHFNPVLKDDIDYLSTCNSDPPSIPPLSSRSSKSESDSTDPHVSSLLCFPLCQRLTAALLDEGKGHAHASKPVRPGLMSEQTWMPATPNALHQFDTVFEERLRVELQQVGLLDHDTNANPVLSELRIQHWHLKNIVAHNTATRANITNKVLEQVSNQTVRRDAKLKQDAVEIKYLESMVDKGGKRAKGRFNKLLNQMHPHRNLKPGDPIGANRHSFGAIGDTAISKKRKRKSSSSDRGHKNTDMNGSLHHDAADNLAPQIADIIWKHNDNASIDLIVKECLERVPILTGDIKEARRKITNCISFSRKPFRFKKSADGLTYSATRV